ncbi:MULTISPECIES: hypothetical protein [unclassified Paenibacillus]|uniref:hypothetical protein n=1 Tax=unclassified Paenibacillus TaxID=185978 RepID=UPI0027D7B7AE|nr:MULTISPECIES: hypothetical protein [unclassified Paenibacillus]
MVEPIRPQAAGEPVVFGIPAADFASSAVVPDLPTQSDRVVAAAGDEREESAAGGVYEEDAPRPAAERIRDVCADGAIPGDPRSDSKPRDDGRLDKGREYPRLARRAFEGY